MGMASPGPFYFAPGYYLETLTPTSYDNGEIWAGMSSMNYYCNNNWVTLNPDYRVGSVELHWRTPGGTVNATVNVYDSNGTLLGSASWTGEANVLVDGLEDNGYPPERIHVVGNSGAISNVKQYLDDVTMTELVPASGPCEFWTALVETAHTCQAEAAGPAVFGLTVGTEYASTDESYTPRVAQLTDTKAVMFYARNSTPEVCARVVTRTGNALSLGPEAVIANVRWSNYVACDRLDDNKAIVAFDTFNDGFKGRAIVVDASGATPTAGAVVKFNGEDPVSRVDVVGLSDTAALIVFTADGAATGNWRGACVACSISGTTLSVGARTLYESGGFVSRASVCRWNNNASHACVVYQNDAAGNQPYTVGINVSGTTATPGTPTQIAAVSATEFAVSPHTFAPMYSNVMWGFYVSSGTAYVVRMSQTNTFMSVPGSPQSLGTAGSGGASTTTVNPSLIKSGANDVLSEIAVGVIDDFGEMRVRRYEAQPWNMSAPFSLKESKTTITTSTDRSMAGWRYGMTVVGGEAFEQALIPVYYGAQ